MTLPIDQIIVGDNVEVMSEWEDGCVDLIVTSPPYPGQKGDKQSVPEWLVWFDGLTAEMGRVLKPNGVLALNVMFKRDKNGWFDTRIFTAVPQVLQLNGLNMIDVYQFVKPNPPPNGPLVYCDIPAWEPVFVATKAESIKDVPFYPQRKPYAPKSIGSNGAIYSTRLHNGKTGDGSTIEPHPRGARQSNVLTLSSSGDQGRPKAKGQSFPLDLPTRFIAQHTQVGDIVLDPCCGVGTTCRAAENLNRRWIGIDIKQSEVDKARLWLRQRTFI